MSSSAISAAASPVPGGELVARAEALRETLWHDAPAGDRDRRLTAGSVAAVTDAGLAALMTPVRFGGHGAGVRALLEVTTELGRGCCSASWVAGVYNAGNFVVSLYPDEVQEEVWGADPHARTALVLGRPNPGVEKVDGGVRVSGRWPYASGSVHAEWIGVLVAVPSAEGPPDAHFALLPAADVRIEDTWTFTGMRGTGSNTVVAEGVFVPAHRLLPYVPVLQGRTDGLVDPANPYRNSLTGVFTIGLIGSMIGGADAALRLVQDAAPKRPVAGAFYDSQAESPSTQLGLAEAATLIDTAQLHARRLADTVDDHAVRGENPDLTTRARARMDSGYVVRRCREAVDILMTVYGSSAFEESNPLQRIWRDVHVGARHAGFGMGIPEQIYGRALVGKDPRELSLLI